MRSEIAARAALAVAIADALLAYVPEVTNEEFLTAFNHPLHDAIEHRYEQFAGDLNVDTQEIYAMVARDMIVHFGDLYRGSEINYDALNTPVLEYLVYQARRPGTRRSALMNIDETEIGKVYVIRNPDSPLAKLNRALIAYMPCAFEDCLGV
jgi:hypothetical protein